MTTFWRDLPREAHLLLCVVAIEMLGRGLVLPFQVIYLSEVRHFSLTDIGLLLALPPMIGLGLLGPAGIAIDRLGARRVQLVTLGALIVGDLLLAFAETLLLAGVALVLLGVGFGLLQAAAQTITATVVPRGQRQRYFGLQFTIHNLGIGLGGVIGGMVLDTSRLATFQTIYVLDALSFCPAVALLIGPLRHVGAPQSLNPSSRVPTSYAVVLDDRAMRAVIVLSLLTSFAGYAMFNTGMPAFASTVGGVSTAAIGIAFAANSIVIVLVQLVVIRRIEGRRRTRVIALMGLTWAASWLLLGTSSLMAGTMGAAVLVAACASLFAIGETLLQPTIPTLVNELAPQSLRGRYNALESVARQVGHVAAPPLAGLLLAQRLGAVLIGVLVVACLGAGAFAVLVVERRLQPVENGVSGMGRPERLR